MPTSTLYETDFYAWANQQAALLRSGQLAGADIANIAEEIESIGKTEKRELVNRLTVLLTHLLKWQYQSSIQSNSWRVTIGTQRLDIADHLADNPSLKATLDESMARAYRKAVAAATIETGLPEKAFPTKCPWSFEQATDTGFLPEGN
jgi:hypothetical protein